MEYLTHLTTLNVFLVWLSAVSLGLFAFVFYKLRNTSKKLNKLSGEESNKWKEIEDKALRDSQSIIESANKKASEITLKATEINNESSVRLQQAIDEVLKNQKQVLDDASTSILRTHQEQVGELNKHILEVAGNIYKDIDTNSRADMQAFIEAIKKQTFEAEKLAQTRIKEEYDKLEQETALRREEKLKNLDENIYKILSNVSKEIIGKSLDLSSQEDLIIRSLEQAKKEGKF